MRDLVGLAPRTEPPIPGTRVVLDLRPLQEPERMPITAAYLESLLAAFAASPLAGESFVPVLRTMRPDPTEDLEAHGLAVAARRRVPPTSRMFRSAGLTLDSFILRAAAVRAAGHPGEDGGPIGAVYHTAGGAVPLGSSLPVVATLLDLAAWELPAIYAASPAARFGHRLRARILRDATRLIVCSNATAESARRRIHIKPERIAVVRLAAGDQFGPESASEARLAGMRARFAIPDRYLVVAGPFDARKDMGTLFQALAALRHEAPVEAASERRPRRQRRAVAAAVAPVGTAAMASAETATEPAASTDVVAAGASPADDASTDGEGRRRASAHAAPPPWPPVLVVADTEEDPLATAALERAADRAGVADLVRFAPGLSAEDLAALTAGARAFVFPSISEGTGIRVIEALAIGVPVLASRVGPLPELVGPAGILVEPRDAARFAAALRAIWAADHIHAQLARTARLRASGPRRTWADVARETRLVYAEAALAGRPAD